MIFVTVGTHEQPFNRLIEQIDILVEKKIITEKVLIQVGYSTYIPKNIQYKRFFTYLEMQQLLEEARIIITHGGPASFLSVLSQGKKPIVVPRLTKFGEHVNNHQLTFARELVLRNYNLTVIENIENLKEAVLSFTDETSTYNSHNDKFMTQFIKIVDELFR
ncbi:glycosyltransferase [Leuconostoc citreum]|uniref:glycosyltransferase n=1 Tax=Leuconostoc citreum TaxID=33964 RepID=UPI000A1E08A6|nr:glycosyltransferase [Leuconostoc citreum]OSP82702.1 multidrug MFS transporter [Leuconostoc citreum]